MKEEYIDIVDENNKTTGEKKSRTEVHSKGFWHRTVHIYFFRRSNNGIEFLVHLRAKHKDVDPDKWDTRFGGHIQAGETVEEGVAHEIKDELGIDIIISDIITGPVLKKPKSGSGDEFNHVYYYPFLKKISDLQFMDKEVQKVKWMAKDDIISDMKNNPDSWGPSLEKFKDRVNYLKN